MKISTMVKNELNTIKYEVEKEYKDLEFKISPGGSSLVNSNVQGFEHYPHLWSYEEYLNTDTGDMMNRLAVYGVGHQDGKLLYSVQQKKRGGTQGVNIVYRYNLTREEAVTAFKVMLDLR